jgi:hypothetical protein
VNHFELNLSFSQKTHTARNQMCGRSLKPHFFFITEPKMCIRVTQKKQLTTKAGINVNHLQASTPPPNNLTQNPFSVVTPRPHVFNTPPSSPLPVTHHHHTSHHARAVAHIRCGDGRREAAAAAAEAMPAGTGITKARQRSGQLKHQTTSG